MLLDPLRCRARVVRLGDPAAGEWAGEVVLQGDEDTQTVTVSLPAGAVGPNAIEIVLSKPEGEPDA